MNRQFFYYLLSQNLLKNYSSIQNKNLNHFFDFQHMGQCTGCNKKQQKIPLEAYWRQPVDTEQYADRSLQKLNFQGIINNFRIKNCLYSLLSVKIEVEGLETFYLQKKYVKHDKTVQWVFQQKFRFQMNEYQLRKTFINIIFQDQFSNNVGSLKVNLFLISTGPYHQDFAVSLQKSEHARVCFDLKISQIVQIELESIDAEVDLLKKHPGQKFSYSIKTIVGNTVLNVCQSSYTVRVMLDDHQQLDLKPQLETERSGTRKKSIKNAKKQISAGHNLRWTKDDCLPMPSIIIKTLVSQLHHSYFQILLWRIKDQCNSHNISQTAQLFGECYIALHKVFSIDPILINKDETVIEERIIQGKQKLWNHGKQIGIGSFKFTVKNEQYIKQILSMVRTQKGVVIYSPVYFNSSNRKVHQCEQLKKLAKSIQEVEKNVIKLDKLELVSYAHKAQSRKIIIQIQLQLSKIIDLLEISSKSSIICYSYSSESEFIQAQQIFIKLGLEMMSWLEEEDQLINQYCWQILIALLKRGQFLLAHLMFDQNQKKSLQVKAINKNLESKLQVSLMYQQFLYKQLALALKSLNVKGLEFQRTFAETFCAIAYFRIPEFRVEFLDAITRADDVQIPEWRGIQFSLNQEIDYIQLKEEVNAFTLLCDWTSSFHKCIQEEEKAISHKAELELMLSEDDWKHRFSKRGVAFFYFIIYWIEYIQSMVVKSKDIQWRYFPGYSKIIKCFYTQMKTRNIIDYPDSLKQACKKLLSNQKLLNTIVLILFSKANIYYPLSVIKVLQFLNDIFSVLERNKKKIPATFNYLSFYKGLKICLDSESSFIISKTLLLLYKHFQLFNLEFRRKISFLMVGRLFFKLALHWSFSVRNIFFHLLIFKFTHFHPKKDMQSCTDVFYQEQVNLLSFFIDLQPNNDQN